jgi:predicted outer membrane protein
MLRRRFVLVGLAASASWPAAPLTSSAQDAAPDLEVDLVRQLMAIGALTLLASRIALPELKIPKLLAFANFEVAEQEASWSILTSLARSDTLTDTADAPTDSELEHRLVPLARNILDDLRRTEGGTAFARQYFLLQVNAHQQQLRVQEDYLRLGKNAHYIPVVKLMDLKVREHLQLLDDIKTDTDYGKGTAPPGR